MTNYLASYHPLCSTKHGRNASKKFDLPPYIDGSCRREPNLESDFPSITGLCRAGRFAPKLVLGDRVIYISVKGVYQGVTGWAMVSALEVIHTLPSHTAAAKWYMENSASTDLPSNCVIPQNPCLPAHLTTGLPNRPVRWSGRWGPGREAEWVVPSLEMWDTQYQERAKLYPQFVVTKEISPSRLRNPQIIEATTLISIFGKIPGTQTPKEITDDQFEALASFL